MEPVKPVINPYTQQPVQQQPLLPQSQGQSQLPVGLPAQQQQQQQPMYQQFQQQQFQNVQPQPVQQQQGYAQNVNQQQAVRCKLPSPFDGGFADIIVNPQDFLVMPPIQQKTGFFDQMMNQATKIAHKATEVTKNYVDNKKAVLCNFCTACQMIDNNQLNFYCCSCKYLNNRLWTPPRKSIYCGFCSAKHDIDLGTNNYVLCTKCSRWNLIPQLRPLFSVPPNHPNLNNDVFNSEATLKAQQAYQQQLQQQQNQYQKQN